MKNLPNGFKKPHHREHYLAYAKHFFKQRKRCSSTVIRRWMLALGISLVFFAFDFAGGCRNLYLALRVAVNNLLA